MKKFFTLKNLLLCAAVLFAIVVFCFSFLTSFRVEAGSKWLEYRGIIWGAQKVAYSNGDVSALSAQMDAVALPLVGAILVLVGAIVACVFGFAFKKQGWAKFAVVAGAALMVLGGVFCFLYRAGFDAALMKYYGVDDMNQVELVWKASLVSSSVKTSCGLPIVSGILAILGGSIACGSIFLKK